jgi:outer membrane protein assembly factor BamA
VVGAFYQHTKQHAEYFVTSPYLDDVLAYVGLPFRLTPFFYQSTYLLYATGDLTNKELAGFVNVDYAVTDKLKLSAGVRVSQNKYENTSFGPTGTGGQSTSFQNSHRDASRRRRSERPTSSTTPTCCMRRWPRAIARLRRRRSPTPACPMRWRWA